MQYGNSLKKRNIVLWLCGLLLCIAFSGLISARGVLAAGASISVTTKKQTVVSGDTVYVVITVKSSSAMTGFEGFFSYDNRVLQFQTGGSVVHGNDDEFQISDIGRTTGVKTLKYSVKFLARREGNTTITLKEPYNVFGESTTEKMSVSYDALTLMVKRKQDVQATPVRPSVPSAVPSGKPAGENTEKEEKTEAPSPTKNNEVSKEVQLKSLKVGGVALSPEFKPEIYRYSGQAATYETKLDISYEAMDPGAKVTVKGNKNLQMGKNTIRILVKGRNGNQQTYQMIIRITEPLPSATPSSDGVRSVSSKGVITLYSSASIQVSTPEKEDIPQGFGETELEIDGKVVKAYALESETEHTYVLIYGKSGESESFYLYDREENSLMPYDKVKAWYRSGAGGIVPEEKTEAEITVQRLKYAIGVLIAFCALMVILVITIYMKWKGMDPDDLETDSDLKSLLNKRKDE